MIRSHLRRTLSQGRALRDRFRRHEGEDLALHALSRPLMLLGISFGVARRYLVGTKGSPLGLLWECLVGLAVFHSRIVSSIERWVRYTSYRSRGLWWRALEAG